MSFEFLKQTHGFFRSGGGGWSEGRNTSNEQTKTSMNALELRIHTGFMV
ncbi:hypothetical protein SNF32_09125 [Enterococcus mundtii]|nr:hypothetical protein [Enterococcus mundtii]